MELAAALLRVRAQAQAQAPPEPNPNEVVAKGSSASLNSALNAKKSAHSIVEVIHVEVVANSRRQPGRIAAAGAGCAVGLINENNTRFRPHVLSGWLPLSNKPRLGFMAGSTILHRTARLPLRALLRARDHGVPGRLPQEARHPLQRISEWLPCSSLGLHDALLSAGGSSFAGEGPACPKAAGLGGVCQP